MRFLQWLAFALFFCGTFCLYPTPDVFSDDAVADPGDGATGEQATRRQKRERKIGCFSKLAEDWDPQNCMQKTSVQANLCPDLVYELIDNIFYQYFGVAWARYNDPALLSDLRHEFGLLYRDLIRKNLSDDLYAQGQFFLVDAPGEDYPRTFFMGLAYQPEDNTLSVMTQHVQITRDGITEACVGEIDVSDVHYAQNPFLDINLWIENNRQHYCGQVGHRLPVPPVTQPN